MRGTRGMFTRNQGNLLEASGECYYFNIPGNVPEDSGECSRIFRRMFEKTNSIKQKCVIFCCMHYQIYLIQ